MAQIFISYAREDFNEVKSLHDRLRAAGFTLWMDKVDLLPGQKWRPAIERAIQTSDFFILCLSKQSAKKRGFLQREIKIALDLWEEKLGDDIYFIPAMLEPVDHCDVPDEILEFQWVELYEVDGWDQLLRALRYEAERRGIRFDAPLIAEKPVAPIPAKPESQRSSGSSLLVSDFTTLTMDAQGKIVERRKGQAQYFVEDLGGGGGLEMVYVPGGSFLMGAADGEQGAIADERPQHRVDVPPLYVGRFAVTQGQWRAVVKWPKINLDLQPEPSFFKGGDLLPVECISWHDAREFCERIKKKTGNAYRLLSEAEWEYACRAGATTPFAFGETITPEIVNYHAYSPYAKAAKGEYRRKTVPVGSLGVANAFGLYDMHGNVWEWCEDERHNNYEDAPTDSSARLSGGDLSDRMLRGGSFGNYARTCRSAYRLHIDAHNRIQCRGVRVVVSARTK